METRVAMICKRLTIAVVAGLLALSGPAAMARPGSSGGGGRSSSFSSFHSSPAPSHTSSESSHTSSEPSSGSSRYGIGPSTSTAPATGSSRYGIGPAATPTTASPFSATPTAPSAPTTGSSRYGIGPAPVQTTATPVAPATGSARYGIGPASTAASSPLTTAPAAPTGSARYGMNPSPAAVAPTKPILTMAPTGSNAALSGMMAARTANQYRQAQSQAFSRPPAAAETPIPRTIVVNHYYHDYGSYTTRRHQFYGGWTEPSYMYRSAPSFGVWDAVFMWWMLDHLTNDHSRFFYDHQNDPGYQAWYQQAQVQAQDNAELRAKLDQLNGQMATMKGQPVENTFMPSDVPADMALRSDAVVQPKAHHHTWIWILVGIGMIVVLVVAWRRLRPVPI